MTKGIDQVVASYVEARWFVASSLHENGDWQGA
jgi:hypothetical protein